MIKWQLPILAATFLAAACDPFPAAPGGDPSVVRVTTNGAISQTVDRVATDAPGTVTLDGAYPDDVIYLTFNKPMNGATAQKYSDTDTNIPIDPDTIGILTDPGNPAAVPPRPAYTDPGVPYQACTPADNLILGGFQDVPGIPLAVAGGNIIAGTGVYPVKTAVCFAPNSATDGSMFVVYPAAPMLVGDNYTVTGTATDYQGKTLTLDVTVTIDASLHASALADGYGVELSWFEAGTPGTYLLETAPDVDGTEPTATWVPLDTTTVPPDCAKFPDSANGISTGCVWQHLELQPGSSHWYRLSEGGTLRPGPHPLVETGTGRSVTLANVAVTGTTTIIPGQLRATWSAVTGANGYVLEHSPAPVPPAAEVWTTIYTVTWTGIDPDVDGSAKRNYIDTGLTFGTTYSYRVKPTYASGFAANPGPVKSKAAPAPPPP